MSDTFCTRCIIQLRTDCNKSLAGALHDIRNPRFPESVTNEGVLTMDPVLSRFALYLERGEIEVEVQKVGHEARG